MLGNFTKFVGPALIGIGLGRNPSGIAQQIMDGFRPLTRDAGRHRRVDRRSRSACGSSPGGA